MSWSPAGLASVRPGAPGQPYPDAWGRRWHALRPGQPVTFCDRNARRWSRGGPWLAVPGPTRCRTCARAIAAALR